MASLGDWGPRRAASVALALCAALAAGMLAHAMFSDSEDRASRDAGSDAAPIIRDSMEPQPLPTPPAATLMPI